MTCTTYMWYDLSMTLGTAIDRINFLLDMDEAETTNTSMRIPLGLRNAAAVAVQELGAAASTTALTAAALRLRLEAIVMQAALDQHYRQFPASRPSLADLAIAAAELDGHPLAIDHDRLRRAAAEILERHPDADAGDVLLWAEARALISV